MLVPLVLWGSELCYAYRALVERLEELPMNRKAFVDGFFELWNQHDAEAMAFLYAPDAVHEDPNLESTLVGRDQIRNYYAMQWARWPNSRHGERSSASDGDRVFVEWWWCPLHAETPDFEVRGVSIFDLSDGEISLDVSYWDPRILGNLPR